MDTGCFTAAQRISCHAMNADIFKPVPERGAHQPTAAARTNKSKADQPKPELAQVVTDSKTGRSYSKGKLLGKVRIIFVSILNALFLPSRRKLDACLIRNGEGMRLPGVFGNVGI